MAVQCKTYQTAQGKLLSPVKLPWFHQLAVPNSRDLQEEKSKSLLFPGTGWPWLQITSV